MSQEQMEEVMKVTDRFATPTVLTLAGAVGGSLAVTAGVFWWALVLWLLSLIFVRKRIPFLKALEVSGLTGLISLLTMLVTVLLQIKMGTITASPSLGLAVSDYDPTSPVHMALSALNPLRFWMVIILGLGLAKLADISFGRASLLVVAFYFLQTSAMIMLGAGMAMLQTSLGG